MLPPTADVQAASGNAFAANIREIGSRAEMNINMTELLAIMAA